jgi:light-harvesting complex 1 beta chain
MGAGDESKRWRSKHMAEEKGSLSGLTEAQAKEFQGIFVTSFLAFITVAVVAHALAWVWRPWVPGPNGYGMLQTAEHAVRTLLS